jgi:hypothetical protein
MQEEYLISSYIYMLKNPSHDGNEIQLQIANFPILPFLVYLTCSVFLSS